MYVVAFWDNDGDYRIVSFGHIHHTPMCYACSLCKRSLLRSAFDPLVAAAMIIDHLLICIKSFGMDPVPEVWITEILHFRIPITY